MRELSRLKQKPLISIRDEATIWGAALCVFFALSSTSGLSLVWFWRQSWASLMLDFGVSTAIGILLRILRTKTARDERQRTTRVLEQQIKHLIGDFRYSLEVEAATLGRIVESIHQQVGSVASVDPRNRLKILDVAGAELQAGRRMSESLQRQWVWVVATFELDLTLPANRQTLQRMLSEIRQKIEHLCLHCPNLAKLMDLPSALSSVSTALPR